MQCSTNSFFKEIMVKSWQESLYKYMRHHSLGFKRILFKSRRICLKDESCNTSNFLIRNMVIVLAKNKK